jgi:hypothetical protein
MKKGSGVRRAVSILAADRLEAMSTKQLLARLARLHFCEQDDSDYMPAEIAGTEGILFKDTVEWRAAYADLKRILATREHVPRPAARKPTPNTSSLDRPPRPRRAIQRGRSITR